jgi:integrase/recombinase XerC
VGTCQQSQAVSDSASSRAVASDFLDEFVAISETVDKAQNETGWLPGRLSPPYTVASLADVDAAGHKVAAAVLGGARLADWPYLASEDVFLIAAMNETLTPSAAFAEETSYLSHLVSTGDYAVETVEKAAALQARFVAYVAARYGITDVREITTAHALGWISAPILRDELRAPAERTRDTRRWALDLFFKTLRGLGLYVGDPLIDIARVQRPILVSRPLLDREIELCRKHARRSLSDTLNPARLALAESMAATSEIAAITIADCDTQQGRVWLPGSASRLHGRWASLLPSSREAIERRIGALGAVASSTLLAYKPRSRKSDPSAPISIALRKILDKAGLSADRSVRPSSIRAWGARRLYDEIRDIEEVAHRLGVRRLDNARDIIGLPDPEPDVPPSHRSTR